MAIAKILPAYTGGDRAGGEPEEDDLFFALKATSDGGVAVIASRADGSKPNDAYILKIKPDGSVYRYHTISENVASRCGLSLDEYGRIEETRVKRAVLSDS